MLPVLEKAKRAYALWFGYLRTVPKSHRYSLGVRIDALLVEALETVAVAGFSPREEKPPLVRFAIRKLDVAKLLLMILWETGSLDDKKYIALSEPLDEVGRMLGGWSGQLAKQNSLDMSGEK